MIMKTKDFKLKDSNGVEVGYFVSSPSAQDMAEAKKVYNNAFTLALKSKAIVRAKLDDLLVEQGLWNDQKQQQLEQIQRDLLESERALEAGGISLKEAKEIAIKMKTRRAELRELISVRNSLDNHTAEGQADSEQFNFFISSCTYRKDNKQKVFKNYDDFLSQNTTELAILAAQTLANLMYGLDEDYENKLPENDFLVKYKFVNKQLQSINKEGKLIDKDGRLIDENGRFIDADGNFVDKYGHRIDENGKYVVEHKPFLDDDGNPVLLDVETNTEESTEKPNLENQPNVS